MAKPRISKKSINNISKIINFSKYPKRAIAASLALGISLGVGFEEFFGIGTWHSYHAKTDYINICFTPPSGCGSLIAREIAKAESSIYVQAYGLTLPSIINQLKLAKNRGVKISVLMDGGNLSDNQSIYKELLSYGIEVIFDKMPGIAHNKVMIIDGRKVITGSFNFTSGADNRNAENVLLIEDTAMADIYLQNWLKRKSANRPDKH